MVVRLRGIKRVRAKGRVYYYHRRTMTRLPGLPGEPEFMAMLAKLERRDPTPAPALPGSLGGIVNAYRSSPEFTGLADRTRADYQKVFDYLKPLRDMPLGEIDQGFLFKLRDKAFGAKKRRFANYLVQVLRLMLNWAKRRGLVERNPAADVETIRRPRDAKTRNRRWTEAEVAAVMEAAPPELRVIIALGLYIGIREGDALKVTWAAYDGAAFEVRQGKTGESLWVPAHRDLRAILDAVRPRRGLLIAVGARGLPYTQTGFQTRFFGLLKRLREAGKIGEGLTFHGLRHTVGNKLAEAGCDPRTIAAMLGQKTIAMAEHYSREADRRDLVRSAVAKMERKSARNGKPADGRGKP